MKIIGATSSTLVSFIIPGLFYYKLTKTRDISHWSMRLVAIGLVLFGICSGSLVLGMTVLYLFKPVIEGWLCLLVQHSDRRVKRLIPAQ